MDSAYGGEGVKEAESRRIQVVIAPLTLQAAVREVTEETGLQVQVQRLVEVYSDPASQVFAYPDGRVTQFVTTTFACLPRGGQIHPDGVETSQAGFFSPDELPALVAPHAPAVVHRRPLRRQRTHRLIGRASFGAGGV